MRPDRVSPDPRFVDLTTATPTRLSPGAAADSLFADPGEDGGQGSARVPSYPALARAASRPPRPGQRLGDFELLAEIGRRNGIDLLSMGMSADYEVAIAFGATHVRLGTAIFGERPPRAPI